MENGNGTEMESRNRKNSQKMPEKVIMQYTGWTGWILQHNDSLQHCLDPFTKTIETL